MKDCKRITAATAGIVSTVLLVGMLFFLSTPGRSLAATWADGANVHSSVQSDALTAGEVALVSSDAETNRLLAVLQEATSPDAPNDPHAHNAINTTLLDYQLPGTQTGGLSDPLGVASNCTGCHVSIIKDNFNGSMMANGMRDPLFRAALVIANKDADFSGNLCIRCHSPSAWINGQAGASGDPNSADGHNVTAENLHGITCTACHRMVPTAPLAGEAADDAVERAALGGGPFKPDSGAYIIDRQDLRRGPFSLSAPHAVAQSTFLQSAELCATCHDIDNPLLAFDSGSNEFKLNTSNSPASTTDRLFPLDRSYSEWKASDFGNGGVLGLDYPGLKRSTGTANGKITVCQDCHMPMQTGQIANGGPMTRTVAAHQWVGGSTTWQDGIIQTWGNVITDTQIVTPAIALNKTYGEQFLQRAATVEANIVNGQLEVKIINNTGHKLPTGYAEGRRMWLEIYEFRGPTIVFSSGARMEGLVGPLIQDPFLKTYEAHMGLTDDHAQAIGRPELAGESFHIILNNTIVKDNRIPPRGFTNAAFAARDMQPVPATYADGQYWDTTTYPLDPLADQVSVRVMYQTATSEYLDFLASEADFDTQDDAVRGKTNWGDTVDNLRAMDIGKTEFMTATHLFLPHEYVAPSGTDTGSCSDLEAPCKTISYALLVAQTGAEIRVAAGAYAEPLQVMTQSISLIGGFTLTNWLTPNWTANPTILDGQHLYRPLTVKADDVTINGFIIRNGDATNFGDDSDENGGGLFVGKVNSLLRSTLLNLRIENNIASTKDEGQGGGLAVQLGLAGGSITATLKMSNITVFSNTAATGHLGTSGGGMSILAIGTSPLNVDMSNVTVQNNLAGNDFKSQGGGISLSLNKGTATIRQSRILNNHTAKIRTFLGGPSLGGGLYINDGKLVLENVLIAGNSGDRGEALWYDVGNNTNSTGQLNYVTMADNYRVANEAGPAVHIEGSLGAGTNFTVENTLVSGSPIAFEGQDNGGPALQVAFASVLVDNNVTTVVSGTLDTTGTPLRGSAGYVNAGTGNFHLTAASDAVDEGNNNPPLVDLDGVTRPKGSKSDIGAYEFAPPNLQNQTITFNALPDKKITDAPFTLSATATSGLPVSFASKTTAVCTISGNTVTLVATGTCTIEATQAGNGSFNPAPPVLRSFAVKSDAKSDQIITFTNPGDRNLGDAFALSASATSGLPVSFVSNSPSICTVAGNSVTLLATGTCSITATQEGNSTINPATPVTQSFAVLPPGSGGTDKMYLPKLGRQ